MRKTSLIFLFFLMVPLFFFLNIKIMTGERISSKNNKEHLIRFEKTGPDHLFSNLNVPQGTGDTLFVLSKNNKDGSKVSKTKSMEEKNESGAADQKKLCLETSAAILFISGIYTGLLTYDAQVRLDNAQKEYEDLTPGQTIGWNQAKWNDEWSSIQDLEKTRNIFLYTSMAAWGAGLVLLGIDLVFLGKKDEQAFLNPGLTFMLAKDLRVNYQYRW